MAKDQNNIFMPIIPNPMIKECLIFAFLIRMKLKKTERKIITKATVSKR